MNVQIIEQSASGVSLQCGKQAAYIFTFSNGRVQVVVKNASNRAWGGMGKFFNDFTQARNNYKTAEIQAMIDTAAELLKKGE